MSNALKDSDHKVRLGFYFDAVRDLERARIWWESFGVAVLFYQEDNAIFLGDPAGGLAQIMVEEHDEEYRLGSGPMFFVSDTDAYYLSRPAANWIVPPCDVPLGRYAVIAGESTDAGAALPIRIVDLSGPIAKKHHASFAVATQHTSK